MALRNISKGSSINGAKRAPLKNFNSQKDSNELLTQSKSSTNKKEFIEKNSSHQLSNDGENQKLHQYEKKIKNNFDKIIPTLKKISLIQHEENFTDKAKCLVRDKLGIDIPSYLLENAWLKPLDIKSLYAWSVFQIHQKVSDDFFNNDPLDGSKSKKIQLILISF